MDSHVQILVEKTLKKYEELSPNRRILIGIGGIPGSGKTTLCQLVANLINESIAKSDPSSPSPAAVIPMDGFHLTREELSAMHDPANAHARRGAPFTFDAVKYLKLVEALRVCPPPPTPITAPSFDHAVKDPKEDDIEILRTHRIILLEGNYVALDRAVWRDAAKLMDELWFVDVDFELARRRLRERHVRAGIVKTIEDGDRRASENDLVNGEEIIRNRLPLDEILRSSESGGWMPL